MTDMDAGNTEGNTDGNKNMGKDGSVVVYTKPHCQQCAATRRHLKRIGVEFREMDALEHLADLKAMGFMAAPVVVTDHGSWSGYRPSQLDTLKA